MKSTGRRHPGATQMQFNTRLGYAEKGGYCRVTEAIVTVKAKVILPRWRQRGKADQDVRLIWDTLSGDIKRHEEQHVLIAQSHARDLERKLLRLGRQKSCTIATQKAKMTADRLLDKHDKAQARFDEVESANFEKRMLKLLRARIRDDRVRPDRRLAGHATPSFFCRLVEDVVYWNTMRSPGLTMRLAACAISATSWKPDRISFSLPGYQLMSPTAKMPGTDV